MNPMRRTFQLTSLVMVACSAVCAPPAAEPAREQAVMRQIYDEVLTHSPAYEQLGALTTRYGGRLSGSAALAGAVEWAERELLALGLDRVWKQEVMVPHWERGARESVRLLASNGPRRLAALALGRTSATPAGGISAGVVEVKSLAEVAALGRDRIAGKIVFYNRPMDPRIISDLQAYLAGADQRSLGPVVAAQHGAVAVLVRSLTYALDDHPHTGSTSSHRPERPAVPAAALSTLAANALSKALAADPSLEVEMVINAKWHPDAVSHNVIGEIRGSEFPDQVIVVGGHLDSWDISPGAHDDGAGIVQSLEVMRIFKVLALKPRHTIRAVLFTAEENGARGAIAYSTRAKEMGEKHLFAIETDSGGFAPRGFSFGSTQGNAHEHAARWRPLFEPYGIHVFQKGRGGTDVAPLLVQGTTVASLVPDSNRYFDIHHTTEDSIDKVNRRELELGAASLAALVYLVDKHGL